jgi:tetratricopeptide (TPR) repeat protein
MLAEAGKLHEQALDIYERLGDRTGVMSTIIAMAYVNYTPVVAVTGSARHLEEIRRVTGRISSMVTESERARQELQMLYGIHVYALAKIVPDLMITRGAEAHRAARLVGDQTIEFAAAGGMVLAHLQMGELDEAARWLEVAAESAASYHTPVRARQLELWRGLHSAAAGDARGMREHLERAVELATQQGRSAARCEASSWLAVEAARLGSQSADEELLQLAERAASQVKEMAASLPGHPPWSARPTRPSARCGVASGPARAGSRRRRRRDAGAGGSFATRTPTRTSCCRPAAPSLPAGRPSCRPRSAAGSSCSCRVLPR